MTHSFPTRRSSDLGQNRGEPRGTYCLLLRGGRECPLADGALPGGRSRAGAVGGTGREGGEGSRVEPFAQSPREPYGFGRDLVQHGMARREPHPVSRRGGKPFGSRRRAAGDADTRCRKKRVPFRHARYGPAAGPALLCRGRASRPGEIGHIDWNRNFPTTVLDRKSTRL